MTRQDTTLHRTVRGHFDQPVEYDIPVSIYPAASNVIIVNAPGAGEAKDGRGDRYDTIAKHIQARGIAAFVTHAPPHPDAENKFPDEPYSYRDASWNLTVVESLANVIEHVLENAEEICGTATPTLYLSGFSAGGSACGAVAFYYPAVKRLLFLSTYDSVGNYFYDGVKQFTGDIYVAHGEQDQMAGFLAMMLPGLAGNATVHSEQIPDCDHRFTGATNSKILSNAFLWAFADNATFPSPEGGLLLYDD